MNVDKIVKRYYIYAGIMLVFRCYFWDIINIISPLLMIFPMLAAAISSLCFLIYAMLYATEYAEVLKRKAYTPLLIISLTIGMALFFPFTQITLELDFMMNLKARNAVVTLIESGKLQPEAERPHLIKLPWYCRNLSKGGGEVVIEKFDGQEYYLFYTFRGIIDNYSGFVHITDGSPPGSMYRYYYQVEKMYDGWYYCSSK